MRLYGNSALLNGMLRCVTLEKAHGEATATLTADLLTALGDAYFQKESLAVGDVVRLVDDEGRERFLGAVQTLRRSPESVRLVACDRGLYLTRNQVHGLFAGSGGEIARAVAKQLGLTVGAVDVPGDYRCLSAGAGESAFALLRRVAGEEREISLKDGALTIQKPSGDLYILPAERILAVEGLADLRPMVNRAVVLDRKGHVAATAANTGEMSAYGQRQRVLAKQGSAPRTQAEEALKGKVMQGSVKLWGNLNYVCGCAVQLLQGGWGMDGIYRVTAVEHRWEAGCFTTLLTLEGLA